MLGNALGLGGWMGGGGRGGMMPQGGKGGFGGMQRPPMGRPNPQQGGAIGGAMNGLGPSNPPQSLGGGGPILQGSQVGNMMQNVANRGNRGPMPNLGPQRIGPNPFRPPSAPPQGPPQGIEPAPPNSPPPMMNGGNPPPQGGGGNYMDMVNQLNQGGGGIPKGPQNQGGMNVADFINQLQSQPQRPIQPMGRQPGGPGGGGFWNMQNRGGGLGPSNRFGM